MTNLTDPTRTGYRAGDNWRVDLKDASPGESVYLHLWKNNIDLGISGPYGTLTSADSAWSLSGSFGGNDVGLWQIQGVIGNPGSAAVSSLVSARISAA
jgi:hypothetical protein